MLREIAESLWVSDHIEKIEIVRQEYDLYGGGNALHGFNMIPQWSLFVTTAGGTEIAMEGDYEKLKLKAEELVSKG